MIERLRNCRGKHLSLTGWHVWTRSTKNVSEIGGLGHFHSKSHEAVSAKGRRLCAWSSQEWKAEATTHDRSGRPDKTFCRMVRKVRLDHEEILLDGTAQSLRNGEPLRDGSGQPDNVNSQEVANSQNFIMGSDTTELELSVESRSFVNWVNDQVRKRQKRISNVAGEESSIFNARRSTSFWILYCVLDRSIKIPMPTKLGRKGKNGSQLLKATETMTESIKNRLNSSGTSSQDSIRCSSMVKSKMY